VARFFGEPKEPKNFSRLKVGSAVEAQIVFGMVAEMKKLEVEVKYIEVPGGSHTNIAGPNMPALFEFFDTHRKHGEPASTRN